MSPFLLVLTGMHNAKTGDYAGVHPAFMLKPENQADN